MPESGDERKASTHEFNNSGIGPLKVPGFGLYIHHEVSPHQSLRFRHGASDFHNDRLTAREGSMLRLMDSMTAKPDWSKKIHNDEIVSKWRKEATAVPDSLINERAFDWCVEELRDKAKEFDAHHGAWTTTYECGSSVAKADNLIPADLRSALKKQVQPLLDANPKDWHPNSNEQVLNLVHPSLYPLVYGRTPVLVNGGTVTFP